MKAWQQFDQRRDDRVLEENFICDADEIGVILVSGADAGEFLQNQLSNDIALIDEQHWQLSSLSTPKGRLLGIFRVLQVANGYLLLTPRSMVPTLLEQLFRYIVGARVQLADASDYFARFALVSDVAAVRDDAALPAGEHGVKQDDKVLALALEAFGEQRRFLVMSLDPDAAVALWQRFAARLSSAGFASWRLAEIRCGVPSVLPQTSGEFVPQMANLAALGAISFKKGCYPGQEIVARTQYLGKLKRRMFMAEAETATLPQPGDDLVVEGNDSADGSGKLVDAAFGADGRCHCLYIARIERAESGSLRLLEQPGVRLRNVELPYSLAN